MIRTKSSRWWSSVVCLSVVLSACGGDDGSPLSDEPARDAATDALGSVDGIDADHVAAQSDGSTAESSNGRDDGSSTETGIESGNVVGNEAASNDAAPSDTRDSGTGADGAVDSGSSADAAIDSGTTGESGADAGAGSEASADSGGPADAPSDASAVDAPPDVSQGGSPDASQSDASLDGGATGSSDSAADVSADGGSAAGDAASDQTAGDAAQADADAASSVTIQLCPMETTLLAGETMAFATDVEGSANRGVDWAIFSAVGPRGTITAGGLYTAPLSPGVFQVRATSQADPTKTATATVTVLAANAVPTLSGTVSYSGSALGRIYVTVQTWEGGATTMLAPGPFLIRGVGLTVGQGVTVRAYRDTLGVGRFVAGADPVAEQTQTWNGTALSGFVLALVDPPALALTAPTGVNVQGADGGAIVGWQRIATGGDNELAAYYHVYASTSSNPLGDAGSTIMRTIRGGTVEAAVVEPLINGTPYYFAVAGVRGGIEGPATIVGPITIGTVTPGVDISGTLSFTGPLPPGNLYAVINNKSRSFVARLDNPTSPQPFTIHGVPPGVYGTGALLDVGADGELGPTDLMTFRTEVYASVTVASSNVTGVALTLPSVDPAVSVPTVHRVDEQGATSYEVEPHVGSGRSLIVKAAVTSGPGIVGPTDLVMGDNGVFGWSIARGAQPSTPGDAYQFEVTFDDGKTCNYYGSVTAVIAGVPTPIDPVGADAGSSAPTFVWTGPNPAPTWFSNSLAVRQNGANNGDVWHFRMPGSRTQANYNEDLSASLATLVSGQSYSWEIAVYDLDGNRSSHSAAFTVP